MYQFDTSSMPSGLTFTTSVMTSFRKRSVSGSLWLAIWWRNVNIPWPLMTSVPCRPLSIQTTALPSAASLRASSSETPSARASLFAISLYRASFAWFSGDVTMAMSIGRPSAVLPISTTFTRPDSWSTFARYS